jgi:hypothetical protein
MDYAFNPDQTTFLTVLDQMLAAPAAGFRPAPGWARFDHGAALEANLDAAGFFDAAAEDSLGPVAAAEMVMRLAAVPVLVESAASALLRPFLGTALPRPLAVVDGGHGAVRFLPWARSLVWLRPDAVLTAPTPASGLEPVESVYAYPMGRLDPALPDWQPASLDPARGAALWQVALAAELVGVLTGGLSAVLAHVRTRQQFGRPLGAFQAVQHRLAQVAVQIDGGRWLVLKAAQSGDPTEAALALAQAQSAAGPVVRDLHQFMGAMGLTLEHPLHRWTYRARALVSALGGPGAALGRLADARWGVG